MMDFKEMLFIRYVGSKNKISKDLAPVIQKYIDDNKVENYLEPFVGGANMINKIKCKNKYGYDIHENLIELLRQAKRDTSVFPDYILEDEYVAVKNNKESYPKWYVGLIGFCASFGAKYFGGYARDSKNDNSGKWSKGAINNLKKQSDSLRDIKFECLDFRDINKQLLNRYVIYCDIPYENTTKYANKEFPYEDFWKWCRDVSKNNIVLVSEYNAPNDFVCIKEVVCKTLLDSNKSIDDSKNIRLEKLFTYKNPKIT